MIERIEQMLRLMPIYQVIFGFGLRNFYLKSSVRAKFQISFFLSLITEQISVHGGPGYHIRNFLIIFF